LKGDIDVCQSLQLLSVTAADMTGISQITIFDGYGMLWGLSCELLTFIQQLLGFSATCHPKADVNTKSFDERPHRRLIVTPRGCEWIRPILIPI